MIAAATTLGGQPPSSPEMPMPLGTIGEAVEATGLQAVGEWQPVVVSFGENGVRNHLLRDCAHQPVRGTLYLASGLFSPADITATGGRTREHVKRIAWLPFDFDLTDYTGLPADSILAWPQDYIDDAIDALEAEITPLFEALGLPIHRVDYTGHGLAVYVYLPEHTPEQVPAIVAAHKAIVERINRLAGAVLADRQVSDAGSRIMRLIPSINSKGAYPRQTETRRYQPLRDAPVALDQVLAFAGQGRVQPPPGRVVPEHGELLDAATIEAVVQAVAPYWQPTRRHMIALGLAGMLAKAGVPESQTLKIVERLSAGDDEAGDRIKAVETSYDRVRAGADVRGSHGLRDALPLDTVEWLDRTLDTARREREPRLIIGSGKTVEPPRSETDLPEIAYFGWFGEYRDLMSPTSEAPDQFHLGSALALAGAMIGRRVHSDYISQPLYANLYVVLVGPSGTSRKDTAIKRALAVPQLQDGMTYVRPAYEVRRDVSSSEGIVSMLEETPNVLLYITELSALKANAVRKGTTTINDRLIEAWDTPHRLENLSKGSPKTAINPYLSIIAATQPGRLATGMSDEDIHSGFANRWLYIRGDGKPPIPRPPAMDRARAWALYQSLYRQIERYPEGTALAMDASANECWDAWYVRHRQPKQWTEDESAMRVRHADLIQKIALTFAVSEGAQAIHVRHLEPAMAVIDWSWAGVSQWLNDWGATEDAKLAQRIRDILGRRGALHKRQLQQAIGRRLGPGVFVKTLDAMLRAGEVEIDGFGVVALIQDDSNV